MVYKSEIVVSRIKDASNTDEVRLIIDKYMDKLKKKHGCVRIDRKYTMDILMALEYHRSREATEQARSNLVFAIEIIKSLHVNAKDTSW